MGLHKLDFLSDAPRNLIFQRASNKTNFGGVITLIYIIGVLLIATFILVDYAAKADYSKENIRFSNDLNSLEKKGNY